MVAHAVQQRDEQPFLHAWASNRAAIALYESLGFELRATVQVAVPARHSGPAAPVEAVAPGNMPG